MNRHDPEGEDTDGRRMTQLTLRFVDRRFEISGGWVTWREGSETREVQLYEHSVDLAWPWYQPWAQWPTA